MAAGRILRRTLSLARTDHAERASTDAAAVIADTISFAKDLAPDGLSYEIALAETDTTVAAPEGELRQVLLNLTTTLQRRCGTPALSVLM